MSLESLPDGWFRFGGGRRWRCAGPKYLCEVEDVGTTPHYGGLPHVLSKVRRIKSFYLGRIRFGQLDQSGTGVDVLVANSLTESLGTVPSPLNSASLRRVFDHANGTDRGVKLDAVVRHVSAQAKFLERREPGYVNPVATPGRFSAGSHHVLMSTALALQSQQHLPPEQRTAAIVDLVCRLPAESLLAAHLAVAYFNKSYARHHNQPPLLAATYNAGSPRPAPANPWNLVQYGEHIDRWVRYYNTSRMT